MPVVGCFFGESWGVYRDPRGLVASAALESREQFSIPQNRGGAQHNSRQRDVGPQLVITSVVGPNGGQGPTSLCTMSVAVCVGVWLRCVGVVSASSILSGPGRRTCFVGRNQSTIASIVRFRFSMTTEEFPQSVVCEVGIRRRSFAKLVSVVGRLGRVRFTGEPRSARLRRVLAG